MKQYDFILAGGGLAGLSLAMQLKESTFRDASVLIIDKAAKDRNDRTWCFWTNRATPFDEIVTHVWGRLGFVGEGFQKELALQSFSYKMIRGLDLYRFAQRELSALPNVTFLRGNVEAIEDDADSASARVDGERFHGRWIFDSRFNPRALSPARAHSHVLWQYFKGWEIETPDKRFHPECATFMDFTTPQHNEMRFFYVLPLSETRALVEYVTQSPVPSDEAFKVYLSEVLGIADYEIRGREGGVNPLSDWTFPRRVGKHSMTIGTCGGRIKPSSGYAFMRIQQDSAAIVNSLERFGDPFRVPADSQYYRLCDALMLELMARQGGQIKSIFTELFKNNPIERVLRFLDEAASPAENAGLIASLPPKLFLQALFRLKVLSLLEGGRKQ